MGTAHRHGNGAGKGGQVPLDVAATLAGKNLLLIGCTGFVGKVALSMLLSRYPGVGKVFALVRPGMGAAPEERFFGKVATSPAFDPLRDEHGANFEAFLESKVIPVAGDIGRPLCNFTDDDFALFERHGGLDAIVNSAGLVSFTPSLESAIRINANGAKHCLDLARKTGARLVHVSTCYVAGRRDGEVWEDEPVVGYFPRHEELRDDDFDAEAEIADCLGVIEQTRQLANDRRHISMFRDRAARSLEEQRRDPDDEATLRLAVARERKLWIHERLTRIGMERADHWGWTNTYTYTKSLGEQILLADTEVTSTIVRPAIVESAVRYPFAGWNEGFNTTAPLVYLVLKGHRQIVAGDDTPLDVIPVDLVCAGILMATAAVLADRHERVYQLGSSGVNPITTARLVELTGLAVRKHYKQKAEAGENPLPNKVRARLEAYAVPKKRFDRTSAPQIKRLAERVSQEIDRRVPRWGAPRLQALAERAKDELARVSEFTGRVVDLIELFLPFTHDHDIRFRSDHTKALFDSLAEADQARLPWDPEAITWRDYWTEMHFQGLVKWVFPVLDDEFGAKPRSVYTYKELLELFDAATKLHRHRVAMRYLPTAEEDAEPVVYTYERLADMALQCAANLRERGVEPEGRVVLMSENRPEWGISYFGILRTGAAAVPLDAQLSLEEVDNLVRASGASVAILSDEVCERLVRESDLIAPAGQERQAVARYLAQQGRDAQVVGPGDLLIEPAVSAGAVAARVRGDTVASVIFTSGTTGEPKGVMLTHKNFSSMAAKLSATFRLYRHDGLLSVLPLHHTFEFSAGLLMPLIHGSSITYVDELSADALSTAFKSGHVTGMVGVPALWQMLHRKINKRVADRGPLVQKLFDTIVELNRQLRDNSPYGLEIGKVLFFPVHRELGGRLRLLISGGSALQPEVMKSFRGLGFSLYEGYGMTEAAPVITAQRPGERPVVGSVGRALPGVDVKIHDPDERGVGEVVAKGPNVMKGYYANEAATGQVLRDGWLHTGDLGRIDEDGNLYIVGRKKEMILGPSGENVYPDELEEVYRDSPYVKELSIVGLPADGGGETVAALVVPDYEADEEVDREAVRQRVRDHVKSVSQRLPLYKRAKVVHLWDRDLPKTSTRKVKRREVVAELERLEKVAQGASAARGEAAGGNGTPSDASWVREVVAQVAQRPKAQVAADTRLDSLGFDSLMLTELAVALEAAGAPLPDPNELTEIETLSDLERLVRERGAAARKRSAALAAARQGERDGDRQGGDIRVPSQVASAGRNALGFGQRMLYERYLDTKVTGKAFVPPFGGFIVAANHSSHLDMGLVKHAVGELGPQLVALAAKDYFFEDPVRKAYFENFTNLVPMERHGSLRESLRLAGEVVRDGFVLLIFPEGTRSDTGVMVDFKPSLGYLAMSNRCGILPMYLGGTHDAMKKGAYLPRRASVQAHIGPFQSYDALCELTCGASRSESYRRVATHVETIVRSLCPAEYAWTLGEAGRVPLAAAEAATVVVEATTPGTAPESEPKAEVRR